MIVRARTVVTMDGPPIDDGAVAIEGDVIAGVGRFREMQTGSGEEVLDLGEQILLPGFINSHCHLDYTKLRGRIPPPSSFTEWIGQINAAKRGISEDDYVASIAEGVAEARRFGTTTMVNLEAFPDLIRRIPAPPIRIWWCAELIDVRVKVNLQNIGEKRAESGGGFGLAPHALYTASAEVFAQCAEVARNTGWLLTTHLAESREEMQMFRDGRGPLFDFMKSIGRPMGDCGSRTPLALFMETAQRDAPWLIAHLNELSENDYVLLEKASNFSIVHCPCSHDYFGHGKFSLEKLRALHLNICLGTDSLASNSSLSLFEEMRALQRREPPLSPKELVAMVTTRAARALGREKKLGRIACGCLADLIAIPSRNAGNSFEQIVAFTGPVTWMMIAGRLVEPG